jgi:hypothetical protein
MFGHAATDTPMRGMGNVRRWLYLLALAIPLAVQALPAQAQPLLCASGLYCPDGYTCLQGNKCGRAAPDVETKCDRPGFKKIGTGCFPSAYVDCGRGIACDPGQRCSGSGKIESACSFYWGPPCARAREGKCPQRQVCNPDAKASGKSCYDPIVSFVCPDRNLVCAKGRECIEKPTIDTACIFVDGPTIPQQQRTSTAPGKPERTSGPERTERPANPEQPRSRIAPGRSEGLLDPEKEDRR